MDKMVGFQFFFYVSSWIFEYQFVYETEKTKDAKCVQGAWFGQMLPTTGFVVSGLNSVEWASFFPSTFLANSITAHCRPRHTPEMQNISRWKGGIL